MTGGKRPNLPQVLIVAPPETRTVPPRLMLTPYELRPTCSFSYGAGFGPHQNHGHTHINQQEFTTGKGTGSPNIRISDCIEEPRRCDLKCDILVSNWLVKIMGSCQHKKYSQANGLSK